MRGLFAVREAHDGDNGFWDWVRQNTPAPDATTQELITNIPPILIEIQGHNFNRVSLNPVVQVQIFSYGGVQ